MARSSGFLIWDFDGSLAYREGGWSGALLEAIHKKISTSSITVDQIRPHLQSGFPWHAPECAHQGLSAEEWWMDVEVIFIHALHEVGIVSKQARDIAKEVRPIYLDQRYWKCYPDSIPALKKLTQLGWQHLLLTNHVPELKQILDALELTRHFKVILNSAETGWEKPNLHAFHLAQDWIISHHKAPQVAKIWLIGDSLSADITGAQEAGLAPILIRKKEKGILSFETLDELVGFYEK